MNSIKVILMKKTTKVILLLISFLACFSLFAVLYCNNCAIALQFAGFDFEDVHEIEELDYNTNGTMIKVIQTCSVDDGSLAIVHMVKNSFGIWSVYQYNYANSESPNTVQYHWASCAGGVKRFSVADNPSFEQEMHYVVCGNNATKLISFNPDQIPPNITINIQQAGSMYWIHAISFVETDIETIIDLESLLKENGCI